MRQLLVVRTAFCLACLFASRARAAERGAPIFGNGDYQNAPRLPNLVSETDG
jgi:hypothetical protein